MFNLESLEDCRGSIREITEIVGPGTFTELLAHLWYLTDPSRGNRCVEVTEVRHSNGLFWLNSPAGSLGCRAIARENGEVGVSLQRTSRVPAYIKQKEPISLSAINNAFTAYVAGGASQEDCQNVARELVSLAPVLEAFNQAQALLLSNGYVVGQIGRRNWVYPEALQTIEAKDTIVFNMSFGANGNRCYERIGSIAELLEGTVTTEHHAETIPDQFEDDSPFPVESIALETDISDVF